MAALEATSGWSIGGFFSLLDELTLVDTYEDEGIHCLEVCVFAIWLKEELISLCDLL